jgi:hypothetical protein
MMMNMLKILSSQRNKHEFIAGRMLQIKLMQEQPSPPPSEKEEKVQIGLFFRE